MATKAEVKNRTLQLLGVLRLGQSAQHQDSTRMETAYQEVYAQLKELSLATWAVAGTIPNSITMWLVALMAHNAIDEYGVSDSRYQRIMRLAGVNGENAKKEIKLLTNPAFESLDEPDDF